MAQTPEEEKLKAAKAAEKDASTSYEKYVSSVDSAASSLKGLKSQLGEVKQAAQESEAETAAQKASRQGVVSVTDALKLIEQEKAAKDKYKQASAKYMSQAAAAFSSSVVDGYKYVSDAAGDLGRGIADTFTSASGLGTMAAGLAVAALPDSVQSPAAKMVEGWLRLKDSNGTDPGVEEKSIDGYDSPENAAASAVEDNLSEEPAYNDSNAGTGPDSETDRQFAADENYKPPTEEDAISVSGSELDKMSDLDELFGGIADKLEASDSPALKIAGEWIEALSESGAIGGIASAAAEIARNIAKDEKGEDEKDEASDDIELYGP